MRPNSCALTYAAVPKDATKIVPKYATKMAMQLHVKVRAARRRAKNGELVTGLALWPIELFFSVKTFYLFHGSLKEQSNKGFILFGVVQKDAAALKDAASQEMRTNGRIFWDDFGRTFWDF